MRPRAAVKGARWVPGPVQPRACLHQKHAGLFADTPKLCAISSCRAQHRWVGRSTRTLPPLATSSSDHSDFSSPPSAPHRQRRLTPYVRPHTMNYALRPATLDDLHSIIPWVNSREKLSYWGGPALTFPPTPQSIWTEICATSENTYTLVNPNGVVVGFGQILTRVPNATHLARIIISPSLRGSGFRADSLSTSNESSNLQTPSVRIHASRLSG